MYYDVSSRMLKLYITATVTFRASHCSLYTAHYTQELLTYMSCHICMSLHTHTYTYHSMD